MRWKNDPGRLEGEDGKLETVALVWIFVQLIEGREILRADTSWASRID